MADRRGTADALCWWQVQVCRCADSEQSACPSGCTVQRSTAALYSAQSDPVHQSTWASRSCHYISRLCVGVSCPHSQSRPGQHTQWSQETSSTVTRPRTSASRRRGAAPCPRRWPARAGAGGGGPAPLRTSASSCRRCSPTKAPTKAPSKAETGGSKVGATNIFSPTPNSPWSGRPSAGAGRCGAPVRIT